jgi:putative ABC transport system substrate-binding protein
MTMWYSAVGFLVTLTLSLLTAPLVAEAQPARKVPRIGFISDTPGPYAEAFRQGLRERGYIEGETIAIEYRWAEGRHDRLPDLVAELVQLQVDVLVPVGTQPSRAAKQVTSTIPIVMAQIGDPVGSGLVANLARPGGNLTGVSVLGPQISAKQLELLKQAVPTASHVAVLWNPTNHVHGAMWREIQLAAPALGVTLHSVVVQQPEDFESAFAAIRTAQVNALHVLQDHLLFSHRTQIVDFAAQSKLPAIYMYREWADAGGLIAYGASLREVHRRVAELVDKILKGAKPADLPVEQVMQLHLVINLKTTKELGLTLPPLLLFQADEMIR